MNFLKKKKPDFGLENEFGAYEAKLKVMNWNYEALAETDIDAWGYWKDRDILLRTIRADLIGRDPADRLRSARLYKKHAHPNERKSKTAGKFIASLRNIWRKL